MRCVCVNKIKTGDIEKMCGNVHIGSKLSDQVVDDESTDTHAHTNPVCAQKRC